MTKKEALCMGNKSALVVVWVALAVVFGFIAIQLHMQAQLDTADDQVVTWLDRLKDNKDEKGQWKKWPTDTLAAKDPWGNNLRVLYKRDKRIATLTVSSDGPDQQRGSADDIKASISEMDWINPAPDEK